MTEDELRERAFRLELLTNGNALISSYSPELNGKSGVWTQRGPDVDLVIDGETSRCRYYNGLLVMSFGGYSVLLEKVGNQG